MSLRRSILSYFGRIPLNKGSSSPPPSPSTAAAEGGESMKDPFLSKYESAFSELRLARLAVKEFGEPPTEKSVEYAKSKVREYDYILNYNLKESDTDFHTVSLRVLAEKQKKIYQDVLALHESHRSLTVAVNHYKVTCMKILRMWKDKNEESLDELGLDVVEVDSLSIDNINIQNNHVDTDAYNEEVESTIMDALLGTPFEAIVWSERNLTYITWEIGYIKGLISLDLSYNHIKIIPESIALLEKLEDLNLSRNNLVSLPDSIGLMENLKCLNVSGNQIVFLPVTIKGCRSLQELHASNNLLISLPSDITFLFNLQKLVVDHNKIRSLPEYSIPGLMSLRQLDISFNNLHCLPVYIGFLINLESLNASSNPEVTELPVTFGELRSLKDFKIGGQVRLPPTEIMEQGIEVVKQYMRMRYDELLVRLDKANGLQSQLSRNSSWPPSNQRRLTPF